MVYNGSRLGKEFSTNTFQTLFNEGKNTSSQIPSSTQTPSVQQTDFSATDSNYAFTQLEEQLATGDYHKQASLDEIFGTFSSSDTGANAEEEDFIRRMKRKKRKGCKRNS